MSQRNIYHKAVLQKSKHCFIIIIRIFNKCVVFSIFSQNAVLRQGQQMWDLLLREMIINFEHKGYHGNKKMTGSSNQIPTFYSTIRERREREREKEKKEGRKARKKEGREG